MERIRKTRTRRANRLSVGDKYDTSVVAFIEKSEAAMIIVERNGNGWLVSEGEYEQCYDPIRCMNMSAGSVLHLNEKNEVAPVLPAAATKEASVPPAEEPPKAIKPKKEAISGGQQIKQVRKRRRNAG